MRRRRQKHRGNADVSVGSWEKKAEPSVETGRWQNLPSGSTFSYFSVFSMSSLHKNKMGNRLEAGQERIKTLGAVLERWPS